MRYFRYINSKQNDKAVKLAFINQSAPYIPVPFLALNIIQQYSISHILFFPLHSWESWKWFSQENSEFTVVIDCWYKEELKKGKKEVKNLYELHC